MTSGGMPAGFITGKVLPGCVPPLLEESADADAGYEANQPDHGIEITAADSLQHSKRTAEKHELYQCPSKRRGRTAQPEKPPARPSVRR